MQKPHFVLILHWISMALEGCLVLLQQGFSCILTTAVSKARHRKRETPMLHTSSCCLSLAHNMGSSSKAQRYHVLGSACGSNLVLLKPFHTDSILPRTAPASRRKLMSTGTWQSKSARRRMQSSRYGTLSAMYGWRTSSVRHGKEVKRRLCSGHLSMSRCSMSTRKTSR